MIVVISDVHLGYEKCNKEAFESFVEEFLEKEKIEHLILLGDILDFWRRFSEGVIFENLGILHRLNNLNTEKHYVIGNHDYSLFNLRDYKERLEFKFTKNLRLESGDKKFRFIHGYQIEYENILPLYEEISEQLCKSGDEQGKILSDLWGWYEKYKKIDIKKKIRELFFGKEKEMYDERWGDMRTLDQEKLSKMIEFVQKSPKDREISPLYRKELWKAEREIAQRQESIKLTPEEILIYGHTHRPFCKNDRANTGSWVSDADKTNSYLIIDDGKMKLNYWK